MKKLPYIMFLFALASALSLTAFAAKEPAFDFSLSIEGQTAVQASPGDILTVTLELKRTDSPDGVTMYAMQDEICYDKTFFRLVENSDLPGEGIRTNDLGLRDHRRAHYLNFASLSGGQIWEANTRIGSFQLEVIAETGSSVIENTHFQVSLPDGSGSYPVTVTDLTVSISDQCLVQFDVRGGNNVASQTLLHNTRLLRPADPQRTGYTFGGWYKDVDCTEAWDFAADKVQYNTHLYAKWEKQAFVQRYVDVRPDDWFFGDVDYVSQKGLMSGVGKDRFAPNESTDRAMIVTILWRLEGKPVPTVINTFADVAPGQWYTDAISWAAQTGIVTGYSATSFGPTDQVTREQMAVILYRYANYKGYDVRAKADLSSFTDHQKVGPWAKDGLAWANANGLINGLPGGLLAPQSNAIRCQTAAILHRFCENIR